MEAGDLYEGELILAGHAAGEADLDNERGRRDALSVTWPSFRRAALTTRSFGQKRPGTPPHRA
jgi:hypothetical protein